MSSPRTRSAPLRLDKFEELRQAKGLTIEEVAHKVDVDLRNVRRWLSGKPVYLQNIARLAAVLGTTSAVLRADGAEGVIPAKPEKPCRFDLQIRLKGYLRTDRQKDHLVCLTQDVVQALAREGISVTGHKATWATSRFAGAGAWRILVSVPAMSDGRPSWAIFAVVPARVTALAEAEELRGDRSDYGELLASGWGRRVPRATLRRVERLCGRSEGAILDLTAERSDGASR